MFHGFGRKYSKKYYNSKVNIAKSIKFSFVKCENGVNKSTSPYYIWIERGQKSEKSTKKWQNFFLLSSFAISAFQKNNGWFFHSNHTRLLEDKLLPFPTSLLACAHHARTLQGFRTFCFHNLHMLPLFCHRLSIETRELRQKTWEIFWKISHVFQIISHVFFFCSDFLQHRFFFHEKPVVSCRSSFGSFSRLLPPFFLYFLALQHSNIKECL